MVLFLHLLAMGQYVPQRQIVFIHGILSGPGEMHDWMQEAQKRSITALAPNIGRGALDSILLDPGVQCVLLAKEIQEWAVPGIPLALVGFSQGGLLARCVVEEGLVPQVSHLITIATPNMGVYFRWCPMCVIPRYGVDPHNFTHYIDTSTFLAPLNNQGPKARSYRKTRMTELKMLGAVWSTLDAIVVPPQSAAYSYYDNSYPPVLIPLRDSQWYRKDSLGIKELNCRKALKIVSVKCPHASIAQKECMELPVYGDDGENVSLSLTEWVFGFMHNLV